MYCLTLRSRGGEGEGEGDAAIGKIALITGLHTVVVRRHAAEENRTKNLLSQEIRLAVEQRALLNVTGLFRVTHSAVVSTVRGLGTPGARAMVAACHNRPERSVLRQTQAVEDFRVRLYGAKRETATLECKLRCSLFLLPLTDVPIEHTASSLLLALSLSRKCVLPGHSFPSRS